MSTVKIAATVQKQVTPNDGASRFIRISKIAGVFSCGAFLAACTGSDQQTEFVESTVATKASDKPTASIPTRVPDRVLDIVKRNKNANR